MRPAVTPLQKCCPMCTFESEDVSTVPKLHTVIEANVAQVFSALQAAAKQLPYRRGAWRRLHKLAVARYLRRKQRQGCSQAPGEQSQICFLCVGPRVYNILLRYLLMT